MLVEQQIMGQEIFEKELDEIGKIKKGQAVIVEEVDSKHLHLKVKPIK